MTQLMLFDAPIQTALPELTNHEQPKVAHARSTTSQPKAETTSGPERMGSLAHLVLARYDMVARRRAAQKQRAAQRQRPSLVVS